MDWDFSEGHRKPRLTGRLAYVQQSRRCKDDGLELVVRFEERSIAVPLTTQELAGLVVHVAKALADKLPS